MRDRGTPAECWVCARVQFTAAHVEALELDRMLSLGMSWELALEALSWVGTREELRALTGRVAVIRSALQTEEPTRGR
jgi:hypothetical protein